MENEKEEIGKLKLTLSEWFDKLSIEEKINILAHAYLNKNNKVKGRKKMMGKIVSFIFGFIVGAIFGWKLLERLIQLIIEKIATGGL